LHTYLGRARNISDKDASGRLTRAVATSLWR